MHTHTELGFVPGILRLEIKFISKSIFILNFDTFIYIYSVNGEIDQLSTNTFKYRARGTGLFTF